MSTNAVLVKWVCYSTGYMLKWSTPLPCLGDYVKLGLLNVHHTRNMLIWFELNPMSFGEMSRENVYICCSMGYVLKWSTPLPCLGDYMSESRQTWFVECTPHQKHADMVWVESNVVWIHVKLGLLNVHHTRCWYSLSWIQRCLARWVKKTYTLDLV